MALVALVLFAVVVAGFLGAALSSRSRMEKKSIASFHERMGQLSGLVQPELQHDATESEEPHELFAETPTHVKVVGVTTSRKVATGRATAPRRSRQRVPRSVAVDPLIESLPRVTAPSGTSPQTPVSQVENPMLGREQVVPIPLSQGSEVASRATTNRRRRISRVSAAARAGGSVSTTEVLHFEDGPAVGDSLAGSQGLKGYERKVNPKAIAVTSAAAVVVLVAIVAVMNTGGGASTGSAKSAATPPPKTQPRSTHTHTSAPAPVIKSPAALSPTSSTASGAVYFVNSSSLSVTVTASSPSWVEESVSPGSPVLWQGILAPGTSKSFVLNSSMWIRTGNVDKLTLSVNGRPVRFSASPGVYNFTFSQGVKA